MRNSSAKNFQARFDWLERIVDGNVNPNLKQIDALVSMRHFCNLEIAGAFSKISYNTLKAVASQPPESTKSKRSLDFWLTIKHLRAQAHHKFLQKKKMSDSVPSLSWEEKARRALLESHIATTAYFDIFYFLDHLLRKYPDCPAEMYAAVGNKLAESKSKYYSFVVGFKSASPKTSFVILDGGKSNV